MGGLETSEEVNNMRTVAAILGVAAFILGSLMAFIREASAAGQGLIIGGAIIIAGVLIASTISETRR
jgi:hypothetical protein